MRFCLIVVPHTNTHQHAPRQLTRNKIHDIESGAFEGFGALLVLRLVGNDLVSVDTGSYNGLTMLSELWLNNNPITTLREGAFDDFLGTIYALNLKSTDLFIVEDGSLNAIVVANKSVAGGPFVVDTREAISLCATSPANEVKCICGAGLVGEDNGYCEEPTTTTTTVTTSTTTTITTTKTTITTKTTTLPETDEPTDAPTEARLPSKVTDAPTDAPLTDAPTEGRLPSKATDAPTDAQTDAQTDAPTEPGPTDAQNRNPDGQGAATDEPLAKAAVAKSKKSKSTKLLRAGGAENRAPGFLSPKSKKKKKKGEAPLARVDVSQNRKPPSPKKKKHTAAALVDNSKSSEPSGKGTSILARRWCMSSTCDSSPVRGNECLLPQKKMKRK